MNGSHRNVSTVDQLLKAVGDSSLRSIEVQQDLNEVPTIALATGQNLAGSDPSIALRFARGSDGIRRSTNNTIENLRLIADTDRCAVFNDSSLPTLGRLELQRISTIGCVGRGRPMDRGRDGNFLWPERDRICQLRTHQSH
jgi:hypothetical protein